RNHCTPGSLAFAGCRPTSPIARAAMVAKIKRVIVASMLDVDKNTERPVTIRRRNSLTRYICFTSESGH
ncbi:MAG: hypothetical protein WA754_01665, partial [Pseudolabrys sp.]